MLLRNLFGYLRLRKLLRSYSSSFPFVPERHALVYEDRGLLRNVVEGGEKIPFRGDLRAIFDLRESTHTLTSIPAQTNDGANVRCTLTFVKKIVNPVSAAYAVSDIETSIAKTIKATVNEVISQNSSSQAIGERPDLANQILDLSNQRLKDWGVEICQLSLQNIDLPADFQALFLQRSRLTMLIDSVSTKKHAETEAAAYAARRSAQSVATGLSILSAILAHNPSAVMALQSVVEIEKARALAFRNVASSPSLPVNSGDFEKEFKTPLTDLSEYSTTNLPQGLSLALDLATGLTRTDNPEVLVQVKELADKIGIDLKLEQYEENSRESNTYSVEEVKVPQNSVLEDNMENLKNENMVKN